MYVINEPLKEEEILAPTITCATGDEIKVAIEMNAYQIGNGFDSQCS